MLATLWTLECFVDTLWQIEDRRASGTPYFGRHEISSANCIGEQGGLFPPPRFQAIADFRDNFKKR
ncbi:MAG: hypothetical protein VXY82_12785 [Planctomycetota bacterium]|nr:hypothetical protein [Planctomycetota bacterium]MEC8571940.1 hypothetical protein [Planctomycetota bacterium]